MKKVERLSYRPDIQGLRAIAVTLVVIYHSELTFSGGYLGVDMFFVISGFVIGRLLLQELDSTGAIGLSEFYSRRVRRILPAMAALLVAVAMGSIAFLGPSSDLPASTLKVGIASIFYGANVVLAIVFNQGYFDVGAGNSPLLHLWTLSVEEQFYIFFPPFLLLLARLARRFKGGLQSRTAKRFILGGLIAATIASFTIAMLLVYIHHFPVLEDQFPVLRLEKRRTLAFFSSPTRAWEFLAGVLLVWVERRGLRLPRRVKTLAAAAGVTTIVAVSLFATGSNPTPGWVSVYVVASTALVIMLGPEIGWVGRVLCTRLAQYLGDRSYGWYLWHWPPIVFTRLSFPGISPWVLLLVGVATLIPTELSYRYIEQPIRLNKTWQGWRAVKLATICCVIPVTVLVGGYGFTRTMASHLELPPEVVALQLDYTAGCNQLYPDDPKVQIDCTWTTLHSKGRIVLIGDSQAGALSEVMRERSHAAGYDFTLTTYSSCPFGDVIRQDQNLSDCHAWVAAWTEYLSSNPPSLVVIASKSSNYVREENVKLADPATGSGTRDESEKFAVWEAGLRRTLENLAAAGTPTVVIHTVPILDNFDMRLCPAWRVVTDRVTGCTTTTSRQAVDDRRRAALAAETNAASGLDNVHLVDFIDELCTSDLCSGYRNGLWLYRDNRHLSVVGAATLGPTIDKHVISHARQTDV